MLPGGEKTRGMLQLKKHRSKRKSLAVFASDSGTEKEGRCF